MAKRAQKSHVDPPSLDRALRDEIARRGMKPYTLALATGWIRNAAEQAPGAVNPSMIQRWLARHELTISLDTAGRLARALDLVLIKRS